MKDADADQGDGEKGRSEGCSVEIPVKSEAHTQSKQGKGKQDLDDALGIHNYPGDLLRPRARSLITTRQPRGWNSMYTEPCLNKEWTVEQIELAQESQC